MDTAEMVHIAQAGQFYEQDYYEPSRTGFKVFDTPFGKIGIVICYDRHLPESIRTCARKSLTSKPAGRSGTYENENERLDNCVKMECKKNERFCYRNSMF